MGVVVGRCCPERETSENAGEKRRFRCDGIAVVDRSGEVGVEEGKAATKLAYKHADSLVNTTTSPRKREK